MRLIIVVLLFVSSSLFAQGAVIPDDLRKEVTAEYSGEAALDHVLQISRHHRIQATQGMSDAIAYVQKELEKLQLSDVHVESFVSDGKTRYGTFVSPLSWTVREGELHLVEPEARRLCRFTETATCLSTLSNGGKWQGEAIDVGAGTSKNDYEGKDVKGKIVFASGYAGTVHREAVVRRGALGVVIYPSDSDSAQYPDLVRYNGLWPKQEEMEKVTFGFQVSKRQADPIQEWLREGKRVVFQANVDASLHAGNLQVLTAVIPGNAKAKEELLLVAHLDHYKPGANDNASGSASLMEIARTLQRLISDGKIPKPARTIRFLWVPEYYGSAAYLSKHPETGKNTIAALNLDMVGEDLEKAMSYLMIVQTPMSRPSFLNDLMSSVAKAVCEESPTAPTGSKLQMPCYDIPFEMGSDHDLLNDNTVGVAAVALGLWADPFHHSNFDTTDKVDPTSLRRVGIIATSAIAWMANAGNEDALKLARFVKNRSYSRLAQISTDRDIYLEWEQEAVASAAGFAERGSLTERQILALASGYSHFVDQIRADTPVSQDAPDPSPASNGERRIPVRTFFNRIEDSYASQWFAEVLGPAKHQWYATNPHPAFDRILFETVNFMDGKRDIYKIWKLVNAELGDVPKETVVRIVEDLAALSLVELKSN